MRLMYLRVMISASSSRVPIPPGSARKAAARSSMIRFLSRIESTVTSSSALS